MTERSADARPTWRLVPSIAADGLTQMAIDDWMLDRVCHGHPPTLRFYTWSEPTLSLGFHQKTFPDRWCDGLSLVRRPTGGRAVLHGGGVDGTGDLTYALAMPVANSRRREIYCELCRWIVEGWKRLGVELYFGGDRDYANRASCFGTATSADLVTPDGTKFIGSAQVYRKHAEIQAVLQHGSMQLDPDLVLFEKIFGEPCRAIEPAIALTDETIATLIDAARDAFGIQLDPRPLDAVEFAEIEARRQRCRVARSVSPPAN
ncbi:MAG: lipoate--protein ligase family protein [Geitlerinemataceae cyanobacterium]